MEAGEPKPAGGPRSARATRTHLSYQPLVPSANKYLQHKWDKASYERHREKLKTARSMLNITPPKVYSHLTLGLKKQQLLEEKTEKIQKENTLLLNKILLIMRSSGGLDNWNHYTKKSLGKERRQREETRIKQENQKIQFHLNHCRSNYNVKGWQKDWNKHVKLMGSMTRYPKENTNKQKGQEKPTEKNSGCDKEKKNSKDATALSAKSKNIKRKEKTVENTKKTELKEAVNSTEHAHSSDNVQVTDDARSTETSSSSDK